MNQTKRLNEKIFSLVPPLVDGGGSLSLPSAEIPAPCRWAAQQLRKVDEELRVPKCRTSRAHCHVPYTAGNEAPSASRHCFSSRLGQTIRLTLPVLSSKVMNAGRHVERVVQRRLRPDTRSTGACATDRPTCRRAAAASGESMNLTARASNRRTVQATVWSSGSTSEVSNEVG